MIIYDEGNWHVVKDILVFGVTELLNSVKELILVGQNLVAVKVVDQGPFAMFTQMVKLYLVGPWRPLEIENSTRKLNLLPVRSSVHYTCYQLVVVSPQQHITIAFDVRLIFLNLSIL